MEFDFRRHRFTLETSQGEHRAVPLEPKTVAQFHAETMVALRDLRETGPLARISRGADLLPDLPSG
jgi:hypothetical protein